MKQMFSKEEVEKIIENDDICQHFVTIQGTDANEIAYEFSVHFVSHRQTPFAIDEVTDLLGDRVVLTDLTHGTDKASTALTFGDAVTADGHDSDSAYKFIAFTRAYESELIDNYTITKGLSNVIYDI